MNKLLLTLLLAVSASVNAGATRTATLDNGGTLVLTDYGCLLTDNPEYNSNFTKAGLSDSYQVLNGERTRSCWWDDGIFVHVLFEGNIQRSYPSVDFKIVDQPKKAKVKGK